MNHKITIVIQSDSLEDAVKAQTTIAMAVSKAVAEDTTGVLILSVSDLEVATAQ